ncbi:MAG TPA: PorP/SprF family type IX secretion system membrane protein [Bacteroidales bacterium]|nr:PorP/SprF family type IX secretion system membrane protein [Bacteroidales bacterium]
MKIKIAILLCWLLVPICGLPQDIHFSQTDNTPLTINPALAGEGNCSGRFISNYRNQWRSVSANPYKTISFSGDMSSRKKKFAFGLLFFNDRTGTGHFNQTTVQLCMASRVQFNRQTFLKLGIQGGWSARSIDMESLTWNSQFDGSVINPDMSSKETFVQGKTGAPDFAAGMLFTHNWTNKNILNIGLSSWHVNKPQESFYANSESLPLRWCGHADMTIKLPGKTLLVYPSAVFMTQASYRQFIFGSFIRYIPGLDSKYTGREKASSIYFGMHYRFGDAIILSTKINYRRQLNLSFSYDINVSRFHVASRTRGAMEISLSYLIPDNRLKL